MIKFLKSIARNILKEEIEQYNVTISEKNADLSLKQASIDNLQKEISLLNGTNELANKLNNKYPSANIEYKGRTFGNTNTMIPIDVRLLITPQDYHIQELIKDNNLYVKDIETDVPKLYKWIKDNYYKYVIDKDNYGLSEFWEFPFEIIEKKRISKDSGFDCDSWANLIVSFMIAAGVPDYMVRVVVGMTYSGFGHSTVYIYSEKTEKWHHINSTYGKYYDRLSLYPTTDDGESGLDNIGIKEVWFSFNQRFAWHIFKTDVAEESYNQLNKNFVINGK